jgi:peptidyl-prolyl cis-trans isomerase B (cyclophilin B)
MHKILKTLMLCLSLAVVAGPGTGAMAKEGKSMVSLRTSMGEIVIELDEAKAPETAANFLQYVRDGFYDGTIFHRVIEGFMIQGGGMDKDMVEKPTRRPIKNEADNGLKNERYAVAMARTQDPNSATAQFFINVKDNPFLNHREKTIPGVGLRRLRQGRQRSGRRRQDQGGPDHEQRLSSRCPGPARDHREGQCHRRKGVVRLTLIQAMPRKRQGTHPSPWRFSLAFLALHSSVYKYVISMVSMVWSPAHEGYWGAVAFPPLPAAFPPVPCVPPMGVSAPVRPSCSCSPRSLDENAHVHEFLTVDHAVVVRIKSIELVGVDGDLASPAGTPPL